MNNELKDKVRGSLIGGAIGDAMGYQIEFVRGIKDKEYTKYKDDFGLISDDTQMTLFTINGLVYYKIQKALGNSVDIIDVLHKAYIDWLLTQMELVHKEQISWIKNLPELHERRKPGITCTNSLGSLLKGSIKNRINDSKGCGGVMRSAPFAFIEVDGFSKGMLSAEATAITHRS